MNELKRVYNAASPAEAEAILYDFMVKYSKIYPKAGAVLEDLTSLFEFFEFPAVIRRSIYTNFFTQSKRKDMNEIKQYKKQSENLYMFMSVDGGKMRDFVCYVR